MSLTKVGDYWIDLNKIEMVGPLIRDRGDNHTYYTVYLLNVGLIEFYVRNLPRDELLKMIKEAEEDESLRKILEKYPREKD